MKLNAYLEYKESGVAWIGNIPARWLIERGKWNLTLKKELNFDRRCTDVLSLTLRGVVDNDPMKPEGLVPKDYKTYQIFNRDDLVFKLIDLENYCTSRVGLVHRKGIMSSAYIRGSVKAKNVAKYLYYLYYSWYLNGVFNKIGVGVRATLSAKDLFELNFLFRVMKNKLPLHAFLIGKQSKLINLFATSGG